MQIEGAKHGSRGILSLGLSKRRLFLQSVSSPFLPLFRDKPGACCVRAGLRLVTQLTVKTIPTDRFYNDAREKGE